METYKGRQFKPPLGNAVKYGQDFRYFIGLPNVIFTVVDDLAQGVMIAARGYGDKDNYGDGRIYISHDDLLPLLSAGKCKNSGLAAELKAERDNADRLAKALASVPFTEHAAGWEQERGEDLRRHEARRRGKA